MWRHGLVWRKLSCFFAWVLACWCCLRATIYNGQAHPIVTFILKKKADKELKKCLPPWRIPTWLQVSHDAWAGAESFWCLPSYYPLAGRCIRHSIHLHRKNVMWAVSKILAPFDRQFELIVLAWLKPDNISISGPKRSLHLHFQNWYHLLHKRQSGIIVGSWIPGLALVQFWPVR